MSFNTARKAAISAVPGSKVVPPTDVSWTFAKVIAVPPEAGTVGLRITEGVKTPAPLFERRML